MWGNNIERAFTRKAGNALIQGSAGDQTKKAMVDNWEKEKKIPLSQVHDEINYSIGSDSEAKAVKENMERAIPLLLPVIADMDLGAHW
jgi:DNA polymerase I-like protein with 3'-5' exonuclease and polymerase domains